MARLDITGSRQPKVVEVPMAPLLVPVAQLGHDGLPVNHHLQRADQSGKQLGALVLFQDEEGKFSLRAATGSNLTSTWEPVNTSDKESISESVHVWEDKVIPSFTSDTHEISTNSMTTAALQTPVLHHSAGATVTRYLIKLTVHLNLNIAEKTGVFSPAECNVFVHVAEATGRIVDATIDMHTNTTKTNQPVFCEVRSNNQVMSALPTVLHHNDADKLQGVMTFSWIQDHPIVS